MNGQITQTKIIEAVLFASDEPVEVEKLCSIAGGLAESELLDCIDHLNREFDQQGHPYRIVEVAGGFQFETIPQYGSFVEKLFHSKSRPKLTRASLETLAIVAYKQPITKAEIDALRGVDSDTPVRTLLNRDLIEVKGRSDTVGKPQLFGSTTEFLRYFGLKEIKDLPGADELASMFDGSEVQPVSPDQLRIDDSILDSRSGTDGGES